MAERWTLNKNKTTVRLCFANQRRQRNWHKKLGITSMFFSTWISLVQLVHRDRITYSASRIVGLRWSSCGVDIYDPVSLDLHWLPASTWSPSMRIDCWLPLRLQGYKQSDLQLTPGAHDHLWISVLKSTEYKQKKRYYVQCATSGSKANGSFLGFTLLLKYWEIEDLARRWSATVPEF